MVIFQRLYVKLPGGTQYQLKKEKKETPGRCPTNFWSGLSPTSSSQTPRHLHFQREWQPDPDFVAGLVNGAGWIRDLKYKSEDNIPADFGI